MAENARLHENMEKTEQAILKLEIRRVGRVRPGPAQALTKVHESPFGPHESDFGASRKFTKVSGASRKFTKVSGASRKFTKVWGPSRKYFGASRKFTKVQFRGVTKVHESFLGHHESSRKFRGHHESSRKSRWPRNELGEPKTTLSALSRQSQEINGN